jgi:hypothetical protein
MGKGDCSNPKMTPTEPTKTVRRAFCPICQFPKKYRANPNRLIKAPKNNPEQVAQNTLPSKRKT